MKVQVTVDVDTEDTEFLEKLVDLIKAADGSGLPDKETDYRGVRGVVIRAIRANGTLRHCELVEVTGETKSMLSAPLKRLLRRGIIWKPERGRYRLKVPSPVEPKDRGYVLNNQRMLLAVLPSTDIELWDGEKLSISGLFLKPTIKVLEEQGRIIKEGEDWVKTTTNESGRRQQSPNVKARTGRQSSSRERTIPPIS